MVRTIEQLLVDDEKVLNKARIHWVVFVWPASLLLLALLSSIFFHPIMGIVIAILTLYPIYQAVIHYLMTDLVLTDRKVMVRMGFLSRDWIRMEFDRIENAYLEQPIVGRMLGYSTVTVSGVGQGSIAVTQVLDGDRFVRELEDCLSQSKTKVEIS